MEMENIVSNFLVSTCRMHTKFNVNERLLFFLPLVRDCNFGVTYTDAVCGSLAEFYIQPINPCIDDLDILSVPSSILALDSNYEIHENAGNLVDIILCCKLESYEQNKSFVRLRDKCLTVYDWHLEEYTFINTPLVSLMLQDSDLTAKEIHKLVDKTACCIHSGKVLPEMFTTSGPALKNSLVMYDIVCSVNCPNWPRVAEEWLKRRRYNGWPISSIINKVIRAGCDVVPATHRDMQEDLNQRRLSFSRAEVILIQSWTKTQQIVYHLLRFFAKREIIRKNCPKNKEVLCTYHLKTLMLWSCEEDSAEWWETSSGVTICCNLCDKLCECLKYKQCPNYFIPEANLLDHEINSKALQQAINTLGYYKDVNVLSQWFMTHYILPVYQRLCDQNETVLTKEKIHKCMISVCEYNEKRQLSDLNTVMRLCVQKCFKALERSYNLHWTDKHVGKIA